MFKDRSELSALQRTFAFSREIAPPAFAVFTR